MSKIIKDIGIKNHGSYFFDDIINTKNFDQNNIKIDEKSYKNILINYIGYITIKDSKYVKINSVMNGYFHEINKSKYLTLVPTNDNKEKTKKYEKLWSKIRNLIRSVIKNSDDYDQKYMKIKFDSDGVLPLNMTI